MEKKGIYAYGVINAPVANLKMNNIFLIGFKDLALVGKAVSIKEFQKKIKKTLKSPAEMEEILKSHQSVLDSLMKKTTVIPFRFGTILKNKKGATGMLRSSYFKFKRLFTKLKNKEEWGVRVFVDRGKLEKALIVRKTSFGKNEKPIQGKGAGTAYLLKKKLAEEREEMVGGRITHLTEKIFTTLEKVATEAKITPSTQRFSERGETLVACFAFLLDKEKVKKFKEQVINLQKKNEPWGLRFNISGPWPAFNFIS